jgi:pilus assembly protein CpaB
LKRSNRLMLLLGVLLAVVAFGGVLMFGSGSSTGTPNPQKVPVVTAAVDVPLGTALDETYLTTIEMATADAVDTFRDPAQVIGLVVRRTVRQGEAFRSTDFQSAGGLSGPDIAASLEAGQRAMAVAVDSLSGVGLLIQAGDYVDVVLAITDQPDPPKAPVVAPFTSDNGLPISKVGDDWLDNTTVKVLVQNVKVLGVTLPTVDPNVAAGDVDPATGQVVNGKSIAILSVTPQEAELIRFTQLDGNLTLIMRSPLDVDAPDVETTGITLRETVEEYGVLRPRPIVIPLP